MTNKTIEARVSVVERVSRGWWEQGRWVPAGKAVERQLWSEVEVLSSSTSKAVKKEEEAAVKKEVKVEEEAAAEKKSWLSSWF